MSAPPFHSICRATRRHLTMTIAEEVSDLVLPRILGVKSVSPYNVQPLEALRSTSQLVTVLATNERIDCLESTEW